MLSTYTPINNILLTLLISSGGLTCIASKTVV